MQTKYGTLEIPPLYADEGFDTWEFHGPASEKAKQEQAIRDAMNYVNKWPLVPSVVVFVGGPGTGKGHLAWAMTVALCEAHELYAKFTNVPDLMRDLRESWGRSDSPPESEKLKTYREPDLLVVDEVSSHAFYGEPSRHLYDLVNFRIEWLRPTILTTNETPDDFAVMLGPALTSRLAGQSGLWDFGSHDYRLVR
jgi:DNA replication protein DnaC